MADPRVQGIGGVFLYANDPAALAEWYRVHLGIVTESWGESRGLELPSRDLAPAGRLATTTLAFFQAPAPLPEERSARINFRVKDLDALLAELRSAGVEIEPELSEDYGRFAWVRDLENNRVELWEPPLEPAPEA